MTEPSAGAPESYYFGCWKEIGHYYWEPGMTWAHGGAYTTPWGYSIDNKDFSYSEEWHLKKRDGWTAIGRRDNTVDTRPASHSTFAFHADLTLEEAVTHARAIFPEIFKRTGW